MRAARKSPALEQVESLSREFSLVCDGDGKVLWADARATRLLQLSVGQALPSLVTPGAEDKLSTLLREGRSRPFSGWEVPLNLQGVPCTVAFSSSPAEEGQVLLVGHVVPEQFSLALTQLTESMAEVVRLNREVVQQKRELERRHAELERLHRDLAESNRGVLAMHEELADHAVELRQTADVRARLVSNVSHEFRTPLHAILGLTNLLADGTDGPLTPEQLKQVGFIRASANELVHLVSDMLDLSKADAGKAALKLERFELGDFWGSLRGMLRPLVPPDSAVELVFEPLEAPVQLETDRAKLSQVMRNLISNALKFTERGQVTVGARLEPESRLRLFVRDTGVGIAPEDQPKVFEEFGQVANPLQGKVQGTGLGLTISAKLAELLGGSLSLDSAMGEGSTFSLTIPLVHDEARQMQVMVERSRQKPANATSILVVEDDRKTLFIYEKYLVMAGFHVLPTRSVHDARELLKTQRPAAIVLDVMLEGETSWSFLADLKSNAQTRDIPVLVVTVTNREQKARALGADEFWLKPIEQDRLLGRLRSLTRAGPAPRVLVIDDDSAARYIIRKHLQGLPYELSEAATGTDGIRQAQSGSPHVIFLDFLLQGMTAFDVLDELKADPRTRSIPVIVITSHELDVVQRRRLLEEAEAVISKGSLSRELAINRIRDALQKAGVTTLGQPG